MPITYDATNNVITVTGYTESVPCAFADLHNADKAGTLQLLPATAAGLDLSLSRQVRPADDKALKLNLIITNFSVAGTVTLTGLDKDGNAQTEEISISANGTYVSTKWFKSIDAGGVDCTGTYTIEITQSRWGVVSKQGNAEFLLQCWLYIGDGSTISWLSTKRETIVFYGSTNSFRIRANGNFVVGELVDNQPKSGSTIIWDGLTAYAYSYNNGAFKVYEGFLMEKNTTLNYGRVLLYWQSGSTLVMKRVHIDDVRYSVVIQSGSNIDLDDVCWSRCYVALYFGGTPSSFVAVGLKAKNCYVGLNIYGVANFDATAKNVEARSNTYLFYIGYGSNINFYTVNVDADAWTVYWLSSATVKVYRQYEFDLKVLDKNGNTINGATVTLYDKNGNQVFQVTTDSNGNIATQTISRGWYEQATGNTLNDLSPHRLVIEKSGYQTYEKKFILEEKTKWKIKLAKAVGIFSNFGSPVVNLDKSNPENEMVMVL